MVGGCCVCSDDRGFEENPLVYCDGQGCDVAVHQACYGIVDVPSGPWFCRKCESQERSAKIKCELCPSKKGALKRCENNGWAHVVCALYIPEVRFGNNNTMEPIILQLIPQERYNKTCYLCEEGARASKASYGACMDCKKTGCKQYFHVTCAQSAGLLCEEAGLHSDEVIYCGYCKQHYNKLKKDNNNRDSPVNKLFKKSCSTNDSSLQPKPIAAATTSTVFDATASNNAPNEKNPSVPANLQSNRKVEHGAKIPGFYSSSMMLSPNSTNSFNIGSPNLSLSTSSSSSSSSSSSPSTSSSRSSSSSSSNSGSPAQASPNFPPKSATIRANPVHNSNQSSQQFSANLLKTLPNPPGVTQNSGMSNQKIDTVQSNGAKKSTDGVDGPDPFKPPNSNVSLLLNASPNTTANTTSSNALGSILSPSGSKSRKKASNNKSRSCTTPKKSTPTQESSPTTTIEQKPKRSRTTKRSASNSSNEATKSKDAIPTTSKRRSRTTSGEATTPKRQRKKKPDDKVGENTTSNDASKNLSTQNQPPSSSNSSGTSINLPIMMSLQAKNQTASLNGKNEPPPLNSSPYSFIDSQAFPKPNPTKLLLPALNMNNASTNESAKSLEELLKNHWIQTSKYILEQAQQFDLASLIGVLHTLKNENERLEERVRGLATRRDELIAMNARLDMPPNNLVQHLKGTNSVFSSLTTLITNPYGSRMASPGSQQTARVNSSVDPSTTSTGHPSFCLNGFKDHPKTSSSPINVQLAHATSRPSPGSSHNTQYMPHIYNSINQYNHFGFDMQSGHNDSPSPSSALSPRQTPRASRHTGTPSNLINNIPTNINSNGMSNGSRSTSNSTTELVASIAAQHQVAATLGQQPSQVAGGTARHVTPLSNQRNTK